MASVSFDQHFQIGGGAYYWPPDGAFAPDEPGTPPPAPEPQAWTPAPLLALDADAAVIDLSFTEPAAWSRAAWHIPASSDGYYVPRFLQPSNRAWIGVGPVEWAASIDGDFQPSRTAALTPGSRNTLHISATAPSAATGLRRDWTQPHTFRLHLLYQDVPQYQWWLWNGQYGILPARNSATHYYFFPQDAFRAKNFYDGYPDLEPVQPVLPPGLTAADYGGLGPVQVPGQTVGPGDYFSNVLDFTLHQEAGTYLEIVSDPYTLSLPAAASTAATTGSVTPLRSVTIVGSPTVGGTLTAVLG